MKLKNIKILLTDVDGVLTDGGMYYTSTGDSMKKFHARDGMGVNLLKKSGIPTIIVTKEKTKMVKNWAKKMNINHLYDGVQEKEKLLKEICQKYSVTSSQIAYIGDDVNDLEVIKRCKLSFCPNDAHQTVKKYVNLLNGIICENNGGYACVRQACDILTNNCTFGEL